MWKFQNNILGIMQNTAYLIWKGQNRKSQNMEFSSEVILISFIMLKNTKKRHSE